MTDFDQFRLDILEKHVLCIYKMLDELTSTMKVHGDAIENLLGIDHEEEA